MSQDILPQKLLTERAAANLTGYKEATLRQSRHTGVLAGRSAPRFLRLGRSIRYRLADLDAWLEEAANDGNGGVA